MKRAALLVALLAVFSATGVSAQVERFTVPIDVTFPVCDGEVVNFVGENKVIEHFREDGSGGFHVNISQNIKVVGTGDEGSEYRGNVAFNLKDQIKAKGLPVTFSQVVTENLIGKGQAPDSKIKIRVAFVVNGVGDVVVDRFDFEATCR